MSIQRIRLELRSIRRQLELIEEELAKFHKEEQRLKFADLEGIWKGANFTDEEIEEAKYKIKEFPQ